MSELERTVLIEAVIDPVDQRLDPVCIVQPDRGEEWSAWLPRYLTPDGRAVAREYEPPAGAVRARVAFFIHQFDPCLPLTTPYGPVDLPPLTPLPERLATCAPYEVID